MSFEAIGGLLNSAIIVQNICLYLNKWVLLCSKKIFIYKIKLIYPYSRTAGEILTYSPSKGFELFLSRKFKDLDDFSLFSIASPNVLS
jgi:hypothetical protein